MIGRQFEGEHGRVFHLDGHFDPRDILMREIRGDYERYSDGKMIAGTGRETGAILVAGMDSTPVESTSADCNSLHSSRSSGRDSNVGTGPCGL